MATARKMPRPSDVLSYWGPTLVELGKFDEGEAEEYISDSPQRGLCFACGFYRPLDRCHIEPRVSGGTDEVSNLHLLCRWCHRLSEGYQGDEYWRWLKGQSMVASMWQQASAMLPGEFVKAINEAADAAVDHPMGTPGSADGSHLQRLRRLSEQLDQRRLPG